MILLFHLTMPNSNSWNGKWNGKDKLYNVCRVVNKSTGLKILNHLDKNSFYYDFGDKWGALVTVTKISYKEKLKKIKESDGFSEYDWMIGEIIQYGKILTKDERRKKNEQ